MLAGFARRAAEVLMLSRNIVILLGLLAIPALLFAQNETITIKGHSRSGKTPPGERALLYGELDGEPVVLRCVLSHADCKELPRGQYDIERLLDGEGSYKDCPNVDIYRLGEDAFTEEPLGEYCLIEKRK